MSRVKLLYIHRFRDRHGKSRFYFRRRGHKLVPLPGLPGSAAFMAAYQAALDGAPTPIGAARARPGTVSALVSAWFVSAKFRNLSATTQATYRRVAERFRSQHGEKPVAQLQPKHVRAIMDGLGGTPAAANLLRSILRLLMQHAVDHDWRPDDPTRDVRRVSYKRRPFATWTEEDISLFEARWALGTRARLAFALLLYTGQRRSDVIRMGRQHVSDATIKVRQQKTGEWLTIPLHPKLREAIDACPAGHLTFLTTELGTPFASGNAFYNWFAECTRAAGVERGRSPHGAARPLRAAWPRPSAPRGRSWPWAGGRPCRRSSGTPGPEQERLAKAAVAKMGRRRPDGA